jgi:2-dehydro-3-deoxyphosphogluconate aldolase/(4S)-4-hydroxy-2-oxoglutarate aldolase
MTDDGATNDTEAMSDDPVTRLTAALRAARILPVVRTADAAGAVEVSGRLRDAGLPIIELTTTIEGWQEAAAAVVHSGDVVVGVGTVTTADQARAAIDLGARFLVSPYGAPAVRAVAVEASVPFVEGGLTPSEVITSAGFGIAKLFPAHVGGPALLRDILTVRPGLRIVPTGGIGLGDVGTWLAAGALAVGVGSDLSSGPDIAGRVKAALAGLER